MRVKIGTPDIRVLMPQWAKELARPTLLDFPAERGTMACSQELLNEP
jgi:hypothetical protein